MRLSFIFVCLCVITNLAFADEIPTKIEEFQSNTSVVIIRGFEKIGEIKGKYGSEVSVEAIEIINANTQSKSYGIKIEIEKKGRIEKSNRSFIDEDEIESLVKGISYIEKIKGDVSKLSGFQADYKTKGYLKISTFSTSSGVMAAIQCGNIGAVSAYLQLPVLSNLKELITKAKTKIDSIKG